MKIKRVKGGLVAWAKTFAKGGNVTEWSKLEADGRDFDAGVIEDRDLASAVVNHYSGKTIAGALTFEPGGKPINDGKAALAEEQARAKAEVESLALVRDKARRFDASEASRIATEEKLKKCEAELRDLKAAMAAKPVPEPESEPQSPKQDEPKQELHQHPQHPQQHGRRK